MTAPNLTVTAEPAEARSLVYGALAAKSSNEFPNGQLSLILTITNNEAATVHLNQVKVSFVGPPSVNPSPIAADLTNRLSTAASAGESLRLHKFAGPNLQI